MIRAVFGLAAGWEILRFAILFYLVYSGFGGEARDLAATAVWFGSSGLVIAAAMMFAAAKPERLTDVSLNLVRIGKTLAVITGGVALFGRMFQAIATGASTDPVDWLRQEPTVLAVVAVDFTLVLFLLSYHPNPGGVGSGSNVDELPDYDVTDVEEE